QAPVYPWRHAIVHKQSRRMRSQEIHYLDHPVIGVVIRVMPASEELQPLADEEDLAFRERHGLPVTLITVDAYEGDASP
ncbi:MAG: CsiV family protein, partial [Pseudomonadota bacterium]